jgi:hypothetical protein
LYGLPNKPPAVPLDTTPCNRYHQPSHHLDFGPPEILHTRRCMGACILDAQGGIFGDAEACNRKSLPRAQVKVMRRGYVASQRRPYAEAAKLKPRPLLLFSCARKAWRSRSARPRTAALTYWRSSNLHGFPLSRKPTYRCVRGRQASPRAADSTSGYQLPSGADWQAALSSAAKPI